MNSRRSFVVLWALLVAISTACPALGDVHGPYLPDPLGLTGITGITYGNANAIRFTQDVICGGQNHGHIDFSYDTWTGMTGNPAELTGGGTLAGGFFLNPDCTLKDGFQLGWVQTVTTTIPGQTAVTNWQALPNVPYPDTKLGNTTDPDYPFESLPGGLNPAPNPLPTLGFQDFPNRFPSDGPQSWLAELGLVCRT